jgi:hypothetical protein
VSFPGGVPIVIRNADHWKLKVHEGFLAGQADDGGLMVDVDIQRNIKERERASVMD